MLKFWNLVEILKFGQTFEIWSKFWNLVEFLKFGQNSEFLCLQILYLKIFHLKILNWICRQCVDCQVRNIDSDCLLLLKSTVTLASRLSTYWRPHFHYLDLEAISKVSQDLYLHHYRQCIIFISSSSIHHDILSFIYIFTK